MAYLHRSTKAKGGIRNSLCEAAAKVIVNIAGMNCRHENL